MNAFIRKIAGLLVCGSVGLGSPLAKARAVAPNPVAFGEASRVAVLPVDLSGELPPKTAAEVRSVLKTNLVEDGIVVVPEAGPRSDACDQACREALGQRANADFLVGAQVTGAEDEFSVTITVFDGRSGEPLAPFADECSICGFVEVRDMVRLRTLDARAEIVRRRRAAAASVAALAGAQCEDPAVGTPQPIAVDGPVAPRSVLTSVGWGLIGGGSAATIGGVVLLAMHKQDAGCPPNPRGGECVPLRFTTAPAGAAVLGVGLATLAGGVVAVVLGRRADRRRDQARVTVRPAAGGLSVRF